MKVSKIQGSILLVGIVLIQLFYFGFDTIQLDGESDQPIESEGAEASFDVEHEIEDELLHLSEVDRDSVNVWMTAADDDVWRLKQLSSFWTLKGKWALAGYYTEKLASKQPTEENYEVAANTYATGLSQEITPEMRTFLSTKALSLYDKAIELSADAYSLSLSRTLLMINHPPQGNPMTGIQALMKISETYPDRPQAFFHLGRLAIQTNQWDKAKDRLEKAYELNPRDQSTICLLSQVYTELNDSKNMQKFSDLCNQ